MFVLFLLPFTIAGYWIIRTIFTARR